MQYYDKDSQQNQQGSSANSQKQATFFGNQPQQQQQQSQPQYQKQQLQVSGQIEKTLQFQSNPVQQQEKQMMSQQQIQLQQQQPEEEQKQNQDSDEDDEEKQKRCLQQIKECERQLFIFFEKLNAKNKKPTQAQCEWAMEASFILSIGCQEMGNIFFKINKNKEAEKWYKDSFLYSEPKQIIDEPIIGPNGEKLNRRENSKLEWYLQRISIANSIHSLFKKRNKTRKIIDLIKTVVSECENCTHKVKIQENPHSNIENLYYHLAEYTFLRMQSSQSLNQKPSQAFISGPSLTNIAQQQQANLLLQKSEIEETMRYAKQCMNILIIKYRNIASKKVGEAYLLEYVTKNFLEKKQIMYIHVMYLIGRTLQWGEFFPESLSFYKQAYYLAHSHFKRRGIHPADGKDDLLNQYKLRIDQVSKIIQNDIDENLSPDQFDKVFREDLEILQVGSDDQVKQSKTLSLNFEAVQPYLLTTEMNDVFDGFASSNVKLKSQGVDEDNANLFSDETLVESQILFLSDTAQKTQQTDKSKKSGKAGLAKSTKQRIQQMTISKKQKIGNLNDQKLLVIQQSQYPKIRKSSLNLVTKESIQQGGSIEMIKNTNIQNRLFDQNNNNDNNNNLFQRKLSRQKTPKLLTPVDQENEVVMQLLENRNQKRVQGQNAIMELADRIQENYNHFQEYKKDLNDFLPQLQSSHQSFHEQPSQSSQTQYPSQQQYQVQQQNFFQNDKKSSSQAIDFKSNQNSQLSFDQYFAKGIASKGLSGMASPNNNLNAYLHSQQQTIQSSFKMTTIKKNQRPLTSNSQVSTYRPQSGARNFNLKLLDENQNLADLEEQEIDISGFSSTKNQKQPNTKTPKSPSYLMNSLYKYELLARPIENKIDITTQKKPFQIKKGQYQIKINTKQNNQLTNNSYNTIGEQGADYQQISSAHQTPLRQSPNRLKSQHLQSKQFRQLSAQGKQRPSTSNAFGNQYQMRQDNLSHFDSNSQIQIPTETVQSQKRQSLFPQFIKTQQQTTSNGDQKNQEELNQQAKQMNLLQKHKHSFEIFDDDGAYNFVQTFDLDKIITQKFERLIAEEGERNMKDKENSLQKLDYVGHENKNPALNLPPSQNDDDLFSEDGDRDGALQDDKQQIDNLNSGKDQNNQMQQDLGADKGYNESDKLTKEKEELIVYKQFKQKEGKRIEEIHSFFKKVKTCKDRFVAFYQKFNECEACIWKLEKFKIKFKVYEQNREGISQPNFNLKNKESIYQFTLNMHLESMFYTGKLIFNIQKTDLDFLEHFLYRTNIISRWGIADFIINEYFSLGSNANLLESWIQYYRSLEEGSQQFILSFDHTIGRYQGEFQNQENSELINIALKIQFLLQQSFKLVKTPNGEKLKFIQSQIKNASKKESLQHIPSITSRPVQQQQQSDEELDEVEYGTYLSNYCILKSFLRVRRQIVRKTIITLETLSPQVFVKFGIQKKMKPLIITPATNSPSNSINLSNDFVDNDTAQYYKETREYIEECKRLIVEKGQIIERNIYMNEDMFKGEKQQQNAAFIQKQFELLNQRGRQKSNVPILNSFGGNLKAQQSIRNNQLQMQSPTSNFNIMSTFNITTSINPILTASRLPNQQNSPNSNSSIDKIQKQVQSRNNSINQLPDLQIPKYSGDMEATDEINSPNENMNSSIDSQQSIMKNIQGGGTGSNSNSQGKEDSRQGMNLSRQESMRKGDKENSRVEKTTSFDEDQQMQVPSVNQTGQNPAIERFILRNINKKSTFSMIRRNEQSDKEISDGSQQGHSGQQEENEYSGDHQRNISINLLPTYNFKENDETPSGSARHRSQLNEFASSFNKNSDFDEKTPQLEELASFQKINKNYNHSNQPEDIIEQFKHDINLSVSSKSSVMDSQDEEKMQNDIEEESFINLSKQKSRRRVEMYTQQSQDSNLSPLPQNKQIISDANNQNIGGNTNFNYDDVLVESESINEEGNQESNQSKQMALAQLNQQGQEISIDGFQRSQSKHNKSEEQNEQESNDQKGLLQDGGFQLIQLQQGDQVSRMREDSKNLVQPNQQQNQSSENTNSTQIQLNEQVLGQQQSVARHSTQLGSNTIIEDSIKTRVDAIRTIVSRLIKIRFCTPMQYIQYFEDNFNIAQIVVPNIFINAFRKNEILLSGIMRLESMAMEEYNRLKEGQRKENKQEIKTISKFGDDDEEEMSSPNKYQADNNKIILDSFEKINYFVTLQLQFTSNAQVEWDIEKLKTDVLIHVTATQQQSDYSQEDNLKFSSTFTFYEFIENLFTEDNDLKIQEYYDTIQRLLRNVQNNMKDGNSTPSTQRRSYMEEDFILNEEHFGLNVETLQYESLNPFTNLNIQFQKTVCNQQFKLNKFIYNIGFTKSQKRTLVDRLKTQMVIVENQLKLIPRRIKRFRLFNDKLYCVDDSSYQALVAKQAELQILFQQQVTAQIKKFSLTSTTNLNISANIQHLPTNLSARKRITRVETTEEVYSKPDESQDKQVESDIFFGEKKKDLIEQKPQQQSNKNISPQNSVDVDESELQRKSQIVIQMLQDIITSERIFHLHQIITGDQQHQIEYQQVLTKKQFDEKQILLQQQQYQQQLQQQQQQMQLQKDQQSQSNETIEIQEIQKSQTRIASLAQYPEVLGHRRESHIQRSSILKSAQFSLLSSQSQDMGLSKKGRKQSLSTQKAALQFKKQIKGDPKNKTVDINNEERERNYKDGRINHPLAMTYYNSILRMDSEDQKKKRQKEILKKRLEERNFQDHREAFRREEDLRIIDNIQSNKDGFRKKIKVEYQIDSYGDLIANISYYDPLSYRVETVRVKEKKNLEKLQNLLQISNPLLRNQRLRDILVKMNMKWSKKIIGRKLEFRSFIETNEEFFNYKLNRKMNPNDEALYKLMTTRNYLHENKEHFTNFLYKVKLALISNDQNAETAEQNYFFNTYFYSTRVQQFQNITNLGRALIQTTVYQSKLLYTTDNYVFIRIDIAPAAKRTKLIKMILDYNDIITIFSKTKYNLKNCLDPEAITKMVIEFAEKVNYSHTQNYNALKIPFWKQFNQISESSDYDLVNQFDFNSMNTKLEISFLSKKSMLTPVLRTLKIIYQGIKKIKGEFLVITVKRYLYLNIDWFQLIIYIPKTCRRFICFLMESDLLKFDPDFMESVLPLIIVKQDSNINDLKQSKNYFQFCEAFDQMHRRLITQEVNEQQVRKSEKRITFRSENWFRKSSQDISSQINLKSKHKISTAQLSRQDIQLQDSRMNNNSLKSLESANDIRECSINSSQLRLVTNSGNSYHSRYASQRTNFVKIFQKNLTEQTSFLEKKVWEHLINSIIIEENKQHKLVVRINTFRGILRETLSSMILNMNERDNILYEFYIEEYKRKTIHSIFSKSTPQMLADSFNQNLYVRIHFFGQEVVHNQKVCGRHLLYSFHKQSRSKLKHTTVTRDMLQQKDSSSQVKINTSQTKIGGDNSNPKISSHPKIQINPSATTSKVTAHKQRTSILEKKGGSLLGNAGIKKNLEKRTSLANNLKLKQEQQVAAEDDPFLYSFRLNNMQDMAIFYANKIKANYNKFVKEREQKSLKGKIQDYLSLYKSKSIEKDGFCKAILIANKNFKRHKDIDPLQKKYFIIYRRILTLSPRQMIAIFYKPNKQTFYIFCWNNLNSKDVTLKKRLKEIEKFIPHATQFLAAKLYKELGDRIYLSLKNQVLLQTYSSLN